MRYIKQFQHALDMIGKEASETEFPCDINIGFQNGGHKDETQFTADNMDDLYALWIDFCSENGINPASVTYIQPVPLKEFRIKITETYTRTVTVKANDYYSADEKVNADINSGEIDLPCDGGEYQYSLMLEDVTEKNKKLQCSVPPTGTK